MTESSFRLVATPVRLSPLAELKIAAGEDSTNLTSAEWETWVLESPAKGVFTWDGTDFHVEVPEGFLTDFASIPFFARWWQRGGVGSQRIAAYFHDYMYAGTNSFSRRQADAAFYQVMKSVDGRKGWFKRGAMWAALRMGGFLPYRAGQTHYNKNPLHRHLW
jgi:hypothetical protein